MCLKPECPHKGERMCSCEPIAGGSPRAKAIHMFQNITDFKMELDYKTLEAPAPYRFCVSGSCKMCGGRLCLSVDLPEYLCGDGFLAVLHYHMKRLHMDTPKRFAGLFREEDRPAAMDWLARKDHPASGVKQSEPVTVYTLIQTSVDVEQALFPASVVLGSYLSVQQAQEKLAEQISAAKKSLEGQYEDELRLGNRWEAYRDAHAGICFFRLEILASELEKEGNVNA